MRPALAFALVFLCACSACGGNAPPRPPPKTSGPVKTWNPTPLSSDGAYPPRYPILSDEELAKRTGAAEALAPGWHVALNVFGFLHGATCSDACPGAGDGGVVSAADQGKVETFLGKNDAVVAANQPDVAMRTPSDNKAVHYVQTGPNGNANTMHVTRTKDGLVIQSHLWPTLPEVATKPDTELEPLLRRIESTPDLAMKRGYRLVAQSMKGPAELRVTACLFHTGDDALPLRERPKHACIDAHTGEDLTDYLVAPRTTVVNGEATKRSLGHAYKTE